MSGDGSGDKARLVLAGDEKDLRVILAELRKLFDSSDELRRLASRLEADLEGSS
jgi:hypothetical protein